MLIVKIFGGLGNQMFQYAFSKYLKVNNQEVYLDTSDYLVHKHHFGYELKKVFGIDEQEISNTEKQKVAFNANMILNRLMKKVGGVEIRRLTECKAYYHFLSVDPTPIAENVYFDGYWQNIKYLTPIRDELKSVFQFKIPLTGQNEMLQRFIQTHECVAVHIRRGDYLQSKKLYSVCGINYYIRAIEYCNQTIQRKLTYIIFSDDFEWVRENLTFPDDTIYVDWNKQENSYIDMQLMGLCQHSIIANSTFSWWPAWLKADEDHIVVMPQNWFVNETSKRLEIKGAVKL